MKKILLSSLMFFLMFFSFSAFADKVVITGQPVVVEESGDMYALPSTATSTSDYYYVTMNKSNRVCYREVQPALAKVDAGIFKFKVGTDTVSVHCYDYSPDYFSGE